MSDWYCEDCGKAISAYDHAHHNADHTMYRVEPKVKALVCLAGNFTKVEADEMAERLSRSSIIEANGVKRTWLFVALEVPEMSSSRRNQTWCFKLSLGGLG